LKNALEKTLGIGSEAKMRQKNGLHEPRKPFFINVFWNSCFKIWFSTKSWGREL